MDYLNIFSKNKFYTLFRLIIIVIIAIMFIFPLWWMFSTSIKLEEDMFVYPPKLFPYPFSFKSYVEAWTMQNFTLYTFNTLKIVLFNIVFGVGASAIVAYGFARFRFRGKQVLFLLVLATMIIPDQLLYFTQYFEFNWFGWINTHLPLIVPSISGKPFYIFLIYQYLRSIPIELDEAAVIDGCNKFQVFYKILLPLLTPVLTTCIVFQFLFSWNDYLGPLIFLQTRDNWTLSLGVASLYSEQVYSIVNWGHRMAMATIFSIAPLIVFFIAQKKLIGGIATTGIKG